MTEPLITAYDVFVFFSCGEGFLSKQIRRITGGSWSHCGIGFETSDGPIYYEALFSDGFTGPRPLSDLQTWCHTDDRRAIAVLSLNVGQAIATEKLAKSASWVGHVGYYAWQLAAMWAWQRFGWKVPKSPGRVVCSEAVASLIHPEIDVTDAFHAMDEITPAFLWQKLISRRETTVRTQSPGCPRIDSGVSVHAAAGPNRFAMDSRAFAMAKLAAIPMPFPAFSPYVAVQPSNLNERMLMIALRAANSAPSRLASITPAANTRIVEGKMTIPYGLWPVTIVNEQGKEETVVQRLDKTVAGRLVEAFNSLRGKVSRFVGGCPVFKGHPDYAKSRTAADWTKLGKCIGMQAANDALEIQADLTPEAKTLLSANEALAPSPHWGLARTQDVHEGKAVCEPFAFYSMGLVARPNIAGAAVNDAVQPAPDTSAPSEASDEMDMILGESDTSQQLCDLNANLLTVQTALDTERSQRQAEAAQLASVIAEKDATIKQLRDAHLDLMNQIQALNIKLEQAKTSLDQATAAAPMNAMNALLDVAVSSGRVLPADRDHWREKITKTPAAANELFAGTPALKTATVVTSERIVAANDVLGGQSAQQRFKEAVHSHMADHDVTWDQAWNACKAKYSEVYKLMPNGGASN